MPRAFALLLCVLGATIIVAALRQSARGRETRSWTRTHGCVVAAHVDEIPGPSEEGGPKFRAVVRYVYEARGRTYESERISVGSPPDPSSSERSDAQRLVERYPTGKDVEVWFDPRDPAEAVLVRGVPRSQTVATVVAGIVLIGIGLFALAR